jgi:hypothetical protein
MPHPRDRGRPVPACEQARTSEYAGKSSAPERLRDVLARALLLVALRADLHREEP